MHRNPFEVVIFSQDEVHLIVKLVLLALRLEILYGIVELRDILISVITRMKVSFLTT